LADKFTPLILDALTRAAATPDGVPLLATKTDPGLFPATAVGKPAAKKALDDGLLQVLKTEQLGKQVREVCTATQAGLAFLLNQANPKQVLEDLVRLLEERRGEVRDLLSSAARMAVGLERLADVVSGVLPKVEAARTPERNEFLTPEVPGGARAGERLRTSSPSASDDGAMPTILTLPKPTAVAELELAELDDLPEAILARLADWTASEALARDCPLPDLFRSLSLRAEPPTIGQFHDCLRELHDQKRIYLHPWTGPLYTLPEPQMALLVGHEVAYYASLRSTN
jgi:hypothetical protein